MIIRGRSHMTLSPRGGGGGAGVGEGFQMMTIDDKGGVEAFGQ